MIIVDTKLYTKLSDKTSFILFHSVVLKLKAISFFPALSAFILGYSSLFIPVSLLWSPTMSTCVPLSV